MASSLPRDGPDDEPLAIGSTRVLLSPLRSGVDTVGRAGSPWIPVGLAGSVDRASKLIGAGFGAAFCDPAAGMANDIRVGALVSDTDDEAGDVPPFAGPLAPGARCALGCWAITTSGMS